MKSWERILHILALLFVISSIVDELFFPVSVRFILDDLLFPFGLIFLIKTFFMKPSWRWFIFAFGAMVTWGLISDVLSHQTIRLAPMGMLLRWLKWPILCITMAELGSLRVNRTQVENSIRFLFLALAGMNILILLNPFEVGKMMSETFSPIMDAMMSNREVGTFRLSGTMRNPNDNGIIFGLFLMYFLHVNARKYWRYIVLACILIFLTQSRTALLISLAIFGLFVLRNNSRKANLVMIPATLASLTIGLFLFRSENLLSILNGSAFQSNSWMVRMEHYNIFLNSGFSDMLFGHGIVLDAMANVGFYFDTEYLSIGYQYGVVGLLIWGAIIGLMFLYSIKANRKSTFGWAILIFIFGIAMTNFTFLNVECATLMMTLFGAWLFGQSNDKLSNHSKEKSK